jgi:glutaredoxin
VKGLFLTFCVVCVVYAGYTRFIAPKAAAPVAESGQVAMQGAPFLTITPEVRKQVDMYSSEKVVMFGATWCGYCAAQRQLFAERGVRYVEIDIDRDPAALDFMQKVLGAPGVPTTVLGTQLIPGYSAQELTAAIKRL